MTRVYVYVLWNFLISCFSTKLHSFIFMIFVLQPQDRSQSQASSLRTTPAVSPTSSVSSLPRSRRVPQAVPPLEPNRTTTNGGTSDYDSDMAGNYTNLIRFLWCFGFGFVWFDNHFFHVFVEQILELLPHSVMNWICDPLRQPAKKCKSHLFISWKKNETILKWSVYQSQNEVIFYWHLSKLRYLLPTLSDFVRMGHIFQSELIILNWM